MVIVCEEKQTRNKESMSLFIFQETDGHVILRRICCVSCSCFCLGLHHIGRSYRGSDVMIFVVRYPWSDPLRPINVYM